MRPETQKTPPFSLSVLPLTLIVIRTKGGETSQCLNLSAGDTGPPLDHIPYTQDAPQRLLTAAVPRTLELKKVDCQSH
jgi:hypothetical protein